MLPSGEFFVNLNNDGTTDGPYSNRLVAQLEGVGKTNRRIRLNITSLGEELGFMKDEGRNNVRQD